MIKHHYRHCHDYRCHHRCHDHHCPRHCHDDCRRTSFVARSAKQSIGSWELCRRHQQVCNFVLILILTLILIVISILTIEIQSESGDISRNYLLSSQLTQKIWTQQPNTLKASFRQIAKYVSNIIWMSFLQHFTETRILPFRNISMILEGLLKNYEKTDRPKDKGALENNQMLTVPLSVEGKGVRIVPLVSVYFSCLFYLSCLLTWSMVVLFTLCTKSSISSDIFQFLRHDELCLMAIRKCNSHFWQILLNFFSKYCWFVQKIQKKGS